MKTTIDTITENQICALRSEAGGAGGAYDIETVQLCNAALADLDRSWEGQESLLAVVEIIRDAEVAP